MAWQCQGQTAAGKVAPNQQLGAYLRQTPWGRGFRAPKQEEGKSPRGDGDGTASPHGAGVGQRGGKEVRASTAGHKAAPRAKSRRQVMMTLLIIPRNMHKA